ncbi:MAG: transcription elongation factor GreA [Acutalibacteraceae bacterium]|nr:transcription elongation factor GreA [Acutalibacteraceae bacterium]
MAKSIQLTKEGLEKLQGELEYLRTTGRTEIAEKIRIARGYGDLSENSEYDEAKNEQAKIEARIVELEKMLDDVVIIEEDVNTDTVTIGVTVTVYDEEFDEELTYKVVGSAEADPMNGLISDDSPVGKALLGTKVGDEVVAETPMGEIKFKILNIAK